MEECCPRLSMRTTCTMRFDAEAGREYRVTRRGDVDETSRDLYQFEILIYVADEYDLAVPLGSSICEDPTGSLLP